MASLNRTALVPTLNLSQYWFIAAISLSFRYMTCLCLRTSEAFCFFRYSGSMPERDFFILATIVENYRQKLLSFPAPKLIKFLIKYYLCSYYVYYREHICPNLGGALEAFPSQSAIDNLGFSCRKGPYRLPPEVGNPLTKNVKQSWNRTQVVSDNIIVICLLTL